jgi:ABC-type sugar transport system ATPase subunit
VLHLSLQNVLNGASFEVAKNTHVALVGPPGAGASKLLRVIAGEVKGGGEVRIGAHDVSRLPRSKRPLLYATSDLGAPGRWSVEHLLVAAVRGRTLDRIDRKRELDFAVERWHLAPLLGHRLDTLSSTERVTANLARIELLKPAVLLADRLLEHANPSAIAELARELYRFLRVAGTTVLAAPASPVELGLTDRLIVLDEGRVVQEGTPQEVYTAPKSEAAARATGEVNVIPVAVRGSEVESIIGAWQAETGFEGNGVALVRPEAFQAAAKGEESDLIFGIEEASFTGGRWLLSGFLSGAFLLRISLPAEAAVHKGRLIALRYDPRRFTLLPREGEAPLTAAHAICTAL